MYTRVGSSGGDGAMHAKLVAMSDEYIMKFKKAASASQTLSWLPGKMDKFKRDVSKATSFIAMDWDPATKSDGRLSREAAERSEVANEMIKALVKGAYKHGELGFAKAGVTTSLGYNFIDLRGPAALLYPVNTPFRDSTPRLGKVNAGTGLFAQWKATRTVGSQYAGVPEGQRAAVSTPDENNYAAAYKAIGVERNVTVEGEWAGEGFTENLSDEHLRGLQSLWLQEEGIMLLGNDGNTGGTGYNGIQLGTAPTPVAVEVTTSGSLASGTKITGYVVLLSAMGNPSNNQYGYQAAPTVTNGLVPSFSVNAPGTGQQINYTGGTSAISAASNSITTAAANHSVSLTVAPANSPTGTTSGYANGTFGFAWFVSSNATPTTANAFLTAITQFPNYTVASAPPTTGQAGNATGLNTDNSAQPYDFTGLITYAARYGYWKDLQGAQLTSKQGGACAEVETALETIFNNYQAGVDAIWGSPDAITSLSRTILANGNSSEAGYQIFMTRDNQNNVLGGIIVSGYQSRYAVNSPMGANVIPLKMHPMLPPGTLFLDVTTNPYPESRIPFTRAIDLMRDYYGYEWPAINRAWAFGTYSNEAQAHYTPWLSGVITGIGQS